MSHPRDQDDALDLIRRLHLCRVSAQGMGFAFLTDLLSAAILEAALQSLGKGDMLSNPRCRLEELIEIKLAVALGQQAENVVNFHPRNKNKRSQHEPDDTR